MERPHGACGLGDQLRAEGQGAGFSASDRCRQLRLVGTSRRAVGELDFVSIHIYPVWEGKDIDDAMPYTIANYQAVRNALPQSQLVITEAGWATVASEFGARADEKKQKRYYRELFAWAEQMQITTFFFEAFDEDWKGNPDDPLGAEKHWGLFKSDRKPKDVVGEIQLKAKPQRESK